MDKEEEKETVLHVESDRNQYKYLIYLSSVTPVRKYSLKSSRKEREACSPG